MNTPASLSRPSSTSQTTPQVTRVLIVDDEEGMRAVTSAIVERLGFEAITAHTGEDAITAFKEHSEQGRPISAVIMDLALPGGMSGLETTDHLKSINAKVPVIASSGYLQQNARAAAIERGFSGILPKPYTPDRLTTELRWVLNQQK